MYFLHYNKERHDMQSLFDVAVARYRSWLESGTGNISSHSS